MRSALYFLLLCVCFGWQSTSLIEITNKNGCCSPDLLGKHNGGNNLVHKRLGGTVAGTAAGIDIYIYIYIYPPHGRRGAKPIILSPQPLSHPLQILWHFSPSLIRALHGPKATEGDSPMLLLTPLCVRKIPADKTPPQNTRFKASGGILA